MLAELEAELGSRDAALLALHYRWRTAFFARLDALLEDAPADHPALAAAQERERCLLHRDLGVELPPRRTTTPPAR